MKRLIFVFSILMVFLLLANSVIAFQDLNASGQKVNDLDATTSISVSNANKFTAESFQKHGIRNINSEIAGEYLFANFTSPGAGNEGNTPSPPEPGNFDIVLAAVPSNGGTVTGGGTYSEGQTITVRASENRGYVFANWSEASAGNDTGNFEIVSNEADYTFTVNADRHLYANFDVAIEKYTISLSANPSQGGTVFGAGEYEAGERITISAEANAGYVFANWTETGSGNSTGNSDIVSDNPLFTFVAESDRTLVANFDERSSLAWIIGTFPSGIRYFDPQNSEWVEWFPFTGAIAIAATDLDNDGTDDLIGVWPGSGIWAYQSSLNDWQLLTTYFPEKISTGDMTGNEREDIIASWSQFGVYYRDSVSESWPQLVDLAPDTFDAGDITGDGLDEFVGSWDGWGIYSRDNADNWNRLTEFHAPVLAVGDMTGNGRADIPCSFPGLGVYYLDSTTGQWEFLHDNHAELLTTGDITGDGNEELVAVFADGVWVYYQEANDWERISQDRPSNIATGIISSQDRPFRAQ